MANTSVCLAGTVLALVLGSFSVNALHGRRVAKDHLTRASRDNETRGGDITSSRDLAFMHVPFNFGHTVENVAFYGNRPEADERVLDHRMQDGGVAWGWAAVSQNISSVGCDMYLTPPNYWPEGLAKSYFGNNKIFGVLRDPYERLVAFFRGGEANYGGDWSKWKPTCDVNGAVKAMMIEYLAVRDTDPFVHGCTFLPQSEYFDGAFPITLPVDARRIPMSINELWADHGYAFQIQTQDILHVDECPEVWSAALAPDTRALVRKVYKKDFELLCATFGYCEDEDTCIKAVPLMCPSNMTEVAPSFGASSAGTPLGDLSNE